MPKTKTPLNILIHISLATLSLATVLAQFPNTNWTFSLLSQPRPQYIIALIPLCLITLILRQKLSTLLSLTLLSLNIWYILPLLLPSTTPPHQTNTLTITHFNLDATATNHQQTLTTLNNHQTDLLFLQEITPWHLPQITQTLTNYRPVHTQPMSNTHGSALFVPTNSTLIFTNTHIIHLPSYASRPLLVTETQLDGTPLTLLSLHVTRPRNQRTHQSQTNELQSVAQWSHQQQTQHNQAVIIIGDFNTTPWSTQFTQLLTEGNLTNAQQGHSLHGTWPSFLPAPLRIPIDHSLHTPHISTLNHTVQRLPQSDHLMLTVTVTLSLE